MTDFERIEKVILYLNQHYVDQPSLIVLAKVAGVSEFHFHRIFKKWAGITPKDFLKFLTANLARKLLHESRDLLTMSIESGLSGPGRLHDLFVTVEAVSPGELKSQGQGIEIQYGFHESPFGEFLIGITKRGICFLAFAGKQKKITLSDLKSKWKNATFTLNQDATAPIAKGLFQKNKKKKIPLLLMGTSFQLKVWEALLRIPEGQVLSYSDVAKFVGSPKASRAVGIAIGKNTIACLIPCHRVIRETGHFGEYRWGAPRKQAVLAWESASKSRQK